MGQQQGTLLGERGWVCVKAGCFEWVAGTLVGTVKIIAYGVEEAALVAACAAARAAIRVRPVALRGLAAGCSTPTRPESSQMGPRRACRVNCRTRPARGHGRQTGRGLHT